MRPNLPCDTAGSPYAASRWGGIIRCMGWNGERALDLTEAGSFQEDVYVAPKRQRPAT